MSPRPAARKSYQKMHIKVIFCCAALYLSDANRLTESVPRWVRSAGYPLELHQVESGGYQLTVHRLPPFPSAGPPAPAVMVVHGLFCSSIDWVFHGPKVALGYLLHDAGLDVWLPNLRGTPASNRHKTLDPSQYQFWNFTFEEQGVEDLLLLTDYILKVTKQEKIHFVANSMGGTSLLTALSEKPEYNDKFHQAILYAPHSNMNNTSGIVRSLSMLEQPLQRLTKRLQLGQFPLGDSDVTLAFSYALCRRQLVPQANICVAMHNLFIGNHGAINVPMFIKTVLYYPTATSMKALLHIFQSVGRDRFAKFDYGPKENVKLYGSPHPKPYNLSNVRVPLILFHAKNDNLVPIKDIRWLKKQLPNEVKTFYIPRDDFGHSSFLWHPNVTDLIYKKTVYLISNFMPS